MQYPVIPCYIFNEKEFINNYNLFVDTFKSIYPNYRLAYSYKTNYTPYIARLVKSLGGYAEVVSQMEYDLARSIGYEDDKIIFNGPCKDVYPSCILNVDSIDEIKKTNNNKIGLRINIDVGQNFISRFGIDESQLDKAFEIAGDRIVGLHCHISQARSLDAWKKRAQKMIEIADKYFAYRELEYIDLGSGMFGDMEEDLKKQFENVPTYLDYATVVAGMFKEHFKGNKKPILFTEPGTTIVNKYIQFICKVETIKNIKNKTFIVVNGSIHNLGEICELKKVPIEVISLGDNKTQITNGIICGYTCLEQDILLKNFNGEISVGDLIVFKNVGGYSLSLKPPFIRPNYPMFNENGDLIKRQETFKEIFETYE